MILTHFSPISHFYTPWKRQKTYGFLTFSGGIEMWLYFQLTLINDQQFFQELVHPVFLNLWIYHPWNWSVKPLP